jgi:3-hydroxyacyl-CoA dehydrogenase/enoyl-CoA hydratase/3-hydroxybutyryl-CoA epimerase
VLQYINGYQSAVYGTGPPAFVARTRELAVRYGERYEPPASLVELAERGEVYSDETAALTAA